LPVWRRGFPFFLARPRSTVEELRAKAARQVWTMGPVWRRLALGGAMTAGWPIVTLIDAVRASGRLSREGRTESFAKLYAAALARNVPPLQYAQYARFLGDEHEDLRDFLMPLDLRGLQRRDVQAGAISSDVQNKARFEQICRTHRLPCVRTLAVFDHGVATGEDVLRTWNQPLFVKALTGNKGAGAELWRPGGRRFVSNGGQDLTVDQLIDSLRRQNCIVQPLLEDDAALRALGTVALSSLRIVTARGTTIPSTAIAASISLGFEIGTLTGHSGAQCGVDTETGTITAVNGADDEIRDRLIGFAIPDWNECLQLVRKAHDLAFPAFATLGWDVALISDGPTLLETNVGWGMVVHQKLTGPLGRTALSEIIAELLAPETVPPYRAGHLPKPASR